MSIVKKCTFTVLELMVAIVIVMVLMGLVVPILSAVKVSQTREAAFNDIQLWELNLESYKIDYREYPATPAYTLSDPASVESAMGNFTKEGTPDLDKLMGYFNIEDSRRLYDDPAGAFKDPWGKAWVYQRLTVDGAQEYYVASPGADGESSGGIYNGVFNEPPEEPEEGDLDGDNVLGVMRANTLIRY